MSNLSVLLVHPDETVHAQFDDLYVHAATTASHQAASTSPVVVSHAWSFAAAVTQLEGAARTGNHFAAAFVAAQWSLDDDRHAPATGFALASIAQLWEVDPQLQVALLAPPGSDVDVDRSTTSLLVLRTPLTSPDILLAARFLGARRYASDEALAKVVAKERERARELEGIIAELEREKALRRDAEDELVRAQRQEAVGQLAVVQGDVQALRPHRDAPEGKRKRLFGLTCRRQRNASDRPTVDLRDQQPLCGGRLGGACCDDELHFRRRLHTVVGGQRPPNLEQAMVAVQCLRLFSELGEGPHVLHVFARPGRCLRRTDHETRAGQHQPQTNDTRVAQETARLSAMGRRCARQTTSKLGAEGRRRRPVGSDARALCKIGNHGNT